MLKASNSAEHIVEWMNELEGMQQKYPNLTSSVNCLLCGQRTEGKPGDGSAAAAGRTGNGGGMDEGGGSGGEGT